MANEKDLVDVVFKGFNPNFHHNETVERKPITVWLPSEYKEKFAALQSQTKSRFGKKIQEMIVKAIDLTEEKAS